MTDRDRFPIVDDPLAPAKGAVYGFVIGLAVFAVGGLIVWAVIR